MSEFAIYAIRMNKEMNFTISLIVNTFLGAV